jgi:hypothetical protein
VEAQKDGQAHVLHNTSRCPDHLYLVLIGVQKKVTPYPASAVVVLADEMAAATVVVAAASFIVKTTMMKVALNGDDTDLIAA